MTGSLELKLPGQVKLFNKTSGTLEDISNMSSSIDLQIASGDAELFVIEPYVDTEAPTWPTEGELAIAEVTQTSAKLSWPEAADNVAVAGYRIYVDGAERMTVPKQELEKTITNLTPKKTYLFTVKAYDAAGNESAGLSETITTLEAQSGGNNWYVSSLSNNADLRTLQVSVAGKALSLTPSFAPGTLAYTVETEEESVLIASNAAHSAAKVTYDGGAVNDGVEVKLREGANVVELKVQAENGTTKTYVVTIHRKAPSTKPNPEQPGNIALTDINTHWAESSIKKAVTQQIVSGYSDKTFRPDNPVTRAEFIVMLTNALKLEGEGQTLSFTDREQIGSWAAKAIAQALEKGIVNGYADGSFRPNANITRMEMAAMIARALDLPLAADTKTSFTDDSEISQWARSAVEAMRQEGIVVGRNGNRFAPHATATRAEVVVMLLRIAER